MPSSRPGSDVAPGGMRVCRCSGKIHGQEQVCTQGPEVLSWRAGCRWLPQVQQQPLRISISPVACWTGVTATGTHLVLPLLGMQRPLRISISRVVSGMIANPRDGTPRMAIRERSATGTGGRGPNGPSGMASNGLRPRSLPAEISRVPGWREPAGKPCRFTLR